MSVKFWLNKSHFIQYVCYLLLGETVFILLSVWILVIGQVVSQNNTNWGEKLLQIGTERYILVQKAKQPKTINMAKLLTISKLWTKSSTQASNKVVNFNAKILRFCYLRQIMDKFGKMNEDTVLTCLPCLHLGAFTAWTQRSRVDIFKKPGNKGTMAVCSTRSIKKSTTFDSSKQWTRTVAIVLSYHGPRSNFWIGRAN